jgi:hypothetical protein
VVEDQDGEAGWRADSRTHDPATAYDAHIRLALLQMREENVTDTAAIRRIRKSLTAAVTGLEDHEGRIDILPRR